MASQIVRRTTYGTDVRIDMFGLEWTVSRDGYPMYVTPCCDASAKGGQNGIVCRKCYADVSPSLGSIPVPLASDDRPEWRASRERLAEKLDEITRHSLGLGE